MQESEVYVKFTARHTEKGQALPLLVLGIVALLGFTALAVDGSMLYSDRRYAQNAADAASLAGAAEAALVLENMHVSYSGWNCSSSAVANAANAARQAAISRAADNGVVIDHDISDQNGVTIQCGVDNSAGWPDKYLDIVTMATVETNTSFAHFVFGGTLQNTVEAVARVRPRQNLAFGHAIVALNPANCQGNQNGVKVHGNGTIYVNGAGIFSNGCLRAQGNPDIEVTAGGINYVGQLNGSPSLFNPTPQQVSLPIPTSAYEIEPPDCSHPEAHHVSGNNLKGNLDPGLYCVSGNLKINGNDSLVGHGVTIVIKTGSVTMNGNAEIQLTAPSESPAPSPAIAGLLFYMPPSNTNVMKINGNSASYFQGTILAPGSDIEMLGTAGIDAYRTQIIGWNVEVGGNADTYVSYTDDMNMMRPSFLDLYR
jgi:hypothetical protein